MMFSRNRCVVASLALIAGMGLVSPALAQIEAQPLDPIQPAGPGQPPESVSPASQQNAVPEAREPANQGPVRIVPRGVLSGVGVGPTPTTPPPALPMTPPSGQANPDGLVTDPGAPVQQTAPPAFFETVTTARLEPLDPSSAGLLTRNDGGFPRNIWAGTSRETIAAVLPKLPVNVTSPTMNELARRLLLTAADVPGRQTDNGIITAVEEDEYDLMRARVERLAAGGELQSLVALFQQLPPEINDDALARARVDAHLLTGDLNDACREASAANKRSTGGQENDAYWFQVVAFCRVVEGNPAGADFATDVLRDMGVNDPAFFTMMARLSLPGGSDAPDSDIGPLGTPTALKLAMLRALNIDVPVGVLLEADPLTLRSIATTPNMPAGLRLEAAEMAARQGALDARSLAAVYGGASFSDVELQNAALILDTVAGARANALVFQAARRTPTPADRATLLNMAWDKGADEGVLILAAQSNVEATQALPVDPALFASATATTKALLAVGDLNGALRWYNMVRAQANTGDVEATTALLELWPLVQIADEQNIIPFSADILDLWWQSQFVLPRGERTRRAALVFALFEALGKPVPPAYWADLYAGAEPSEYMMPALPIWRAAVAAGQGGRLGETVLMGLVSIGDQGPGAANPAVLGNVIQALGQVGLAKEARSMALEAMLEAGL